MKPILPFKRSSLCSLLLAAVLGSGCWPARFTTSPGVRGVVVDARTRQPLASAEVAVSWAGCTCTNLPTTREGWEQIPAAERPGYVRAHLVTPSLPEALARLRPPTVVTGPDGKFEIPRAARWGLYIVPMDLIPPSGTLVIRREGYEPVVAWAGVRSITNFGTVCLQPLAR